MVREYLENYQNELIEKRDALEKRYNELEFEIRGTIHFILYLEKEDENDYEAFSPRKIYPHHKNKISDLKEKQKSLQDEEKRVTYELSDIKSRLAELSSVIKVVEQNDNNLSEKIDNNEMIRLKFLETQELERQRIARDLHDSTVQDITGIIYKTEFCTKLIDIDTLKCKKEMESISRTLHGIVNEMRELIYNLRPMSYDDMGLDTTIAREISKLRDNQDITLRYYCEENLDDIKPVISLTILRVLQEACNNIIKHAQAKNVSVFLERKQNELILIIEDDGNGFDMKHVKNMEREDYSGFGLSMMQERVYLLSGTMDIQSELNKGTKIIVRVPLNISKSKE